jgi:hypothetical protein
VRIRGALRLYPRSKGKVSVAADKPGDRGGCFHLEQMDAVGRLGWVKRPEGSKMKEIRLSDFVAWLETGGLGDNEPDTEGGDDT